MRYFSPSAIEFPSIKPVTKWQCIIIFTASLLFSLTERTFGFGVYDMNYDSLLVMNNEWWRLITYFFIENDPISLIFSVLTLYFLGNYFERRWGSKDYLSFFIKSTLGAAIIAIPLSYVFNTLLLFEDKAVITGPGTFINALLVALAITLRESKILLGFIIPIKVRTVIYLILLFQYISGIMTGSSTFSITLSGMIMGYLLVTGIWKPSKIKAQFYVWKNKKKSFTDIHIVPPRDDNTLH